MQSGVFQPPLVLKENGEPEASRFQRRVLVC